MSRDSNAIFERHTFNWDKWDNVGGAQSRVRSLMLIQINQFGRFANTANCSFLHRFPFTHERNDAAVVVSVHFAVEKIDAVQFHGFDDRVNFRFISPFGEVRHAFDQSLHKREEYPGGVCPAREAFNR